MPRLMDFIMEIEKAKHNGATDFANKPKLVIDNIANHYFSYTEQERIKAKTLWGKVRAGEVVWEV